MKLFRKNIRCKFGYHNYRYTGEQVLREHVGWSGFNHICTRCGRKIWFIK